MTELAGSRVRPAAPLPIPDGAGFRSDINGLRAIAIAAVVAFHLANGAAPGGFVGVDVFFVISGYLMTNIVLGGLRTGRFRLGRFYLARLRRIGPALVAFCALLWLFGAVALDPWTFQDLAKSLPYALLFVSNIVFARGGGYFAQDSSLNWFLHTWSLSVEWQFYLLYPLLLIALARWAAAPARMWGAIAALAAASFILAVALPQRAWTLDFYVLPTRAWELLAGALCAGLESRLRMTGVMRGLLHVVGMVLIALGVAVARPGEQWPAWPTLLPAGGAALVIVSALRKSGWAEVRAVDWIGRASYSIYLWHWPVVVWMRRSAIELTWPVAIAALAAMLVLGVASYWLVERRLTGWLFAARPWRWALGGTLAAVTLALALTAGATGGLEALRTAGMPGPVRAALADDRRAARDWAYPQVCGRLAHQGSLISCQIGDPTARQVLVLGDSHADQLGPRYAHAFDHVRGAGLTIISIAGCIPIPHVSVRGSFLCGRSWDEAYRYAETAGFARVVVVSAWPRYFDRHADTLLGLTRIDRGFAPATAPSTIEAVADADFTLLAAAVRRLQAHGVQVVVIGTTPGAGASDPRAMYARAFWRGELATPPLERADYERQTGLVRQRLAWLGRTTGTVLVDPLDGLCLQGVCPTTEGGRTLYKDFGHYRASMMTSARFAYLDPWLAPAAPPIRLK